MNMEPQNEPSIIAETVAFVLDTIMMVMQEAFQFTVESTKHAAQVHGVFTTEMQDHFYQMGCMVCVCVCVGVLGRRIVAGIFRVAWYIVYHAVLIVWRIVYRIVRYWCWPAEAAVKLLLWIMHCLINMLPDV